MNWDRIEGSWKQLQGKVKEKWGDLTDDDLDRAEGKRDQVVGALQARYGWERDRAERELDDLVRTW
ncbi:MAG: CsbD family protein [Isosphaeraceae bacterium]